MTNNRDNSILSWLSIRLSRLKESHEISQKNRIRLFWLKVSVCYLARIGYILKKQHVAHSEFLCDDIF